MFDIVGLQMQTSVVVRYYRFANNGFVKCNIFVLLRDLYPGPVRLNLRYMRYMRC